MDAVFCLDPPPDEDELVGGLDDGGTEDERDLFLIPSFFGRRRNCLLVGEHEFEMADFLDATKYEYIL